MEELPPMLIQVGSLEILLDECKLFAERAKSSGLDVTFEIWEDMIHGFQDIGNEIPESKQAYEHIEQFVQKYIES